MKQGVWWCLLLIVWVISHRYEGISDDAVFYAGQALHRLYPEQFRGDLFFEFGSQDGFTLFTAVYAPAIAWLGLSNASEILLAAAQLAWITAAAWLLRPLLHGLYYWFALVLVFSLPSTYGSLAIFQYAEPVLTARSWAEPLALVAVGFSVRGFLWCASCACLVAGLVHPIMAMPACLFVAVWFLRPNQLLWLAILGGLLSAYLAWQGVTPFRQMFAPMDDVWLRLSIARSPFTFFGHWRADEYYEPGVLAVVLALGAIACPATLERKVSRVALRVFAIGIALAVVPIFWPSVLFVQIQAWRVLWLVKILTIAVAVLISQEFWKRSSLNRLLIGGLAACGVNIDNALALVAALTIAAIFLMHNLRGVDPPLSSLLKRSAWLVIATVVFVKAFSIGRFASIGIDLSRSASMPASVSDQLFLLARDLAWVIGPSTAILLCWAIRRDERVPKGLAVGMGVALTFCVYHWNGTGPLQARDQAAWEQAFPSVANLLEPTDLVYWEDGYRNLWFGLHRGNYASFGQAAGIIFSRQTAVEAARRLRRLERLGVDDGHLAWLAPGDHTKKRLISLPGVIHVCHDPILDYVILSRALSEGVKATFPHIDSFPPNWHLYDCSLLRGLPDPYRTD